MDLVTNNLAYTAIEGVLLTLRRRLAAEPALRFADILATVPQAIFATHWQPAAPSPGGNRDEETGEAQALRLHNNLTPGNCIEAKAIALRAIVRADEIDPVLAAFGPQAQALWHVDPGAFAPSIFPEPRVARACGGGRK